MFRRLALRWRLVLAFLSVSVLPVLLASFLAAQVIATMFERNLEQWLGDAARFMAQQSMDAQREAERAVAIVAAGLEAHGTGGAMRFALSAQLLTSVGYDLVVVYDEEGQVLRRYGRLDATDWLPRSETSGFFSVVTNNGPVIFVGASHRFQSDGRRLLVFIADIFNDSFADLSHAISSLDVRVLRVDGQRALSLGASDFGTEARLPEGVLARLEGGEPSVIVAMTPEDDLAAGFAPMLDAGGRIVGLVVCRLSNDVAYLAHVRTWTLFAALSACAGLLSLLVGLLLSKRIADPLRALSGGLRHVQDGDYQARLRPAGGAELEELAEGFNRMAAQLDTLRQREGEMRRREQLATLGEAAAAIAHEVRNPLGIIKTSAQVLRMKERLPEASDRLVGFVLDEVGRIDNLLKDLLDYVRPQDMTVARLDLYRDVVAGALEFAAPELERRGVTCAIDGPRGDVAIEGDAARLRQVLLNLLLNAMDAMPAGGRLTVGLRREGKEVTLMVEDTGTGIAPGIRDRIFQPFVTDKPNGTGLGLAKVWAIMEQHGGSVACDAAPGGQGTVFTLRFPAAGGR